MQTHHQGVIEGLSAHLFERYLTRPILGTTTATQKVPVELVVIPSKNPGILLIRTSFCPACIWSLSQTAC